jgi:hypothetical protein
MELGYTMLGRNERRAYWERLINSMPNRLARVRELEGDMTKF